MAHKRDRVRNGFSQKQRKNYRDKKTDDRGKKQPKYRNVDRGGHFRNGRHNAKGPTVCIRQRGVITDSVSSAVGVNRNATLGQIRILIYFGGFVCINFFRCNIAN
ncbi:hypothetical protein SDC9_145299 [bioreactor metagenome]|uniref:Uncharacterized protein n=1 Tax=bioreactor metagenome TaxID=1076179 RepID=A0A645EAG0_9ZZZZ